MEWKGQFLTQWTGSTLTLLVFTAVSLAPAFAQDQLPASPAPSASSHDLPDDAAANDPASVHPFGTIDLTAEDLHLNPGQKSGSASQINSQIDSRTNSIDLPDRPGDTSVGMIPDHSCRRSAAPRRKPRSSGEPPFRSHCS
jgi:hypothetical protein